MVGQRLLTARQPRFDDSDIYKTSDPRLRLDLLRADGAAITRRTSVCWIPASTANYAAGHAASLTYLDFRTAWPFQIEQIAPRKQTAQSLID